ncbi:hypothetical protein [Deinococcus petrolearius]|uniref:Uncharacterized protein n=1 Tax=Deinococcus petrolearius TaxID=1751295 RepID=A0ABW1DIG1_9DEIO
MTRNRCALLGLCALLLAAPVTSGAAAQTATATTPGTAQGSPAPTSPLPTSPAPAQVRPVPASTAPVLSISAPVGTAAEYVTTVSTRLSVSDVQVRALPGGGATEADLNAARRAFAGGAGALDRTQVQQGKAFLRVAGRQPDGPVRLVTTLVQGGAGSPAVTVDTQALLGGLIGPLTGGALGQLRASPLSVATTTTYRGSGPQGQAQFDTRAAGRWTFRTAGGPKSPELTFELSDLNASGTASYRRDGLPEAATQRQRLRLNATFRQGGVQVQLVMTLDQTVSLTPR